MTTQYAIITLTHARTELDISIMESHISAALAINNPNKVTVICDEDVATIIVYPDEDDASEEPLMLMDAGLISTKLNELIQNGEASAWANLDSICEPANDGKEIRYCFGTHPCSSDHYVTNYIVFFYVTSLVFSHRVPPLQSNIFSFVQRKRFL